MTNEKITETISFIAMIAREATLIDSIKVLPVSNKIDRIREHMFAEHTLGNNLITYSNRFAARHPSIRKELVDNNERLKAKKKAQEELNQMNADFPIRSEDV